MATVSLALLAGCDWFKHAAPRAVGGWYVEQPGYSQTQPVVVGDTLYAATGDGRVIARDTRTGTPIWTATVATRAVSGGNLLLAGGVLAVPIVRETRGLDAATGAILWTYEAPIDSVDGNPPLAGQVVNLHLDADDSTVFIPAWGGAVAAVRARTGTVKWQWRPPALPHRFGAEGVTVRDGTVYVSLWHFLTANGLQSEAWVIALDARTGAERWRTILPYSGTVVCLPGRPAVTDRVVAVLTISGEVFGLDRATGQLRWTAAKESPDAGQVDYATLIAAAAVGDTILADAGTMKLRALAASDGRVLWRSRYFGEIKNDLTISDTRIYGSDGSYLHTFDRRTGAALPDRHQPRQEFTGIFSSSVAVDARFVYAIVNGAVWAFPE